MAHPLRLTVLLALALPSGVAAQEPDQGSELRAQVARLRGDVIALQGAMQRRELTLDEL